MEKNDKFLQMPVNLSLLNELHLNRFTLMFKSKFFVANVITRFMEYCEQLNTIIVSYCNEEESAECLESIQSAINRKFDKGIWNVAKGVSGSREYALHIKRRRGCVVRRSFTFPYVF